MLYSDVCPMNGLSRGGKRRPIRYLEGKRASRHV